MAALNLKVEKRKIYGRKAKRLRKEGILPANIYGKNIKSLAVQLPLVDFLNIYKEAGETGLINLKLDSESRPVLIHNVQTDPVTDAPIHVDFLQVDVKEKVKANVPLETVGESPAQKSGEGVLVQQLSEIEVEALPTNLPDKLEVDVSSLLKVGDEILVKDIIVDRQKVNIKADPEEIVVKIEPKAKEEIEEVPVPKEPEAEAREEEEPQIPQEGENTEEQQEKN